MQKKLKLSRKSSKGNGFPSSTVNIKSWERWDKQLVELFFIQEHTEKKNVIHGKQLLLVFWGFFSIVYKTM